MKHNNIMSFIMLFAAAIVSILCIVRRVDLLPTLQMVLVTLIIFGIIGFVAQKIIEKMDEEVKEAEEQRRLLEEEEKKRLLEAEAAAEAGPTEENAMDADVAAAVAAAEAAAEAAKNK